VLGRLVSGSVDGLSSAGIQRLADEAVPPDRAADWTHAVMDLGATVCRPARPDCGSCPARAWCRYAAVVRSPIVAAARTRHSGPAFPATSRWLRGRILDRLRDAGVDEWLPLEAPIGTHDEPTVRACLARLALDGLVEVHPERDLTARLPVG
jgi:A/G-specific adenine glycosylase